MSKLCVPGGSYQNTLRVISWCLNMDPKGDSMDDDINLKNISGL